MNCNVESSCINVKCNCALYLKPQVSKKDYIFKAISWAKYCSCDESLRGGLSDIRVPLLTTTCLWDWTVVVVAEAAKNGSKNEVRITGG